MTMNPWMKMSLLLATVILTGVSVVFTVLLWAKLPGEFWMKVLTGAAGLAMELCKFSLLPLSFLLLQQRKTGKGLVLLLLGGCLFLVSIGASVMFLEAGERDREQSSQAWHQRQDTLRQLDKRIELGQESAREDIENGYRQRAADTLAEVDQVQLHRQALLARSIEYSEVFLSLPEKSRLFAWLLLALLIDGCSVAGWSILAAREESSGNSNQKMMNADGYSCEEPEPSRVNEAVMNRIVSGVYGKKITIRGVMEKERLGYPKIKPVFDSLESQGILISSNRGYLLNHNGDCYVPGETDRLL